MVSHITYINPEASLWKFSFLSLLYLKPHCLVHPNSTGMSFQYLLSNNLKCMIYYHHSKLLLNVHMSWIHWRLWLACTTTLVPTLGSLLLPSLSASPCEHYCVEWGQQMGKMTKTQNSSLLPVELLVSRGDLSCHSWKHVSCSLSQYCQHRTLKILSEMPLKLIKIKVSYHPVVETTLPEPVTATTADTVHRTSFVMANMSAWVS